MDIRIGFNFLFGFVGGTIAYFLNMPLPSLLGGILGTAGFVLFFMNEMACSCRACLPGCVWSLCLSLGQ